MTVVSDDRPTELPTYLRVILKCNGEFIYTPPPLPMFCGGEETTPPSLGVSASSAGPPPLSARRRGGAGGFAFPLGLRSLKLAERPGSSVVDLAERPRRREATSESIFLFAEGWDGLSVASRKLSTFWQVLQLESLSLPRVHRLGPPPLSSLEVGPPPLSALFTRQRHHPP